MSSKNKFTRSRRATIMACCLLLTPIRTVLFAESAGPLSSDFATHSSVPDLRPVTTDNSSADPSMELPQPAGSSEPPAPEPGPIPLFPVPAGAASIPVAPDPVASAPVPSGKVVRLASLGPIAPFAPPGSILVASNDAVPGALADAATTDLASNNSAPSIARASNSAGASTPPPSPNATINLINLMVKRKLISQDDAEGLIRQSQQEADVARAQAATTQAAADRALTAQQNPAPEAVAPPASGDDEVRVTYVPDVVKKQITDQVTQNVMQQTRDEHLADTVAASQVPEWVKRFHVMGDVRLRYENDRYPSGNAVGNFTNFNSINTSANGFNVNTATPQLPQYNADQDRNRFRLRVRVGAGIDLGDNFTSGVRIATGSDDNPVTENQTLGGANSGQGGNFGKYQIWLDRGFIRYEYGGQPAKEDLTLTVGRFDNPFFNTSMMWADDLGFDGAVFKGKYQAAPGLTPFLTFGGFPIFNTDLNFSSNQSAKFSSEDKYLLAVQGGTRWDITKDFNFVGAAAYYDFQNVQGKVSDPITNSAVNAGNTDDSRPSFAQNGNTYVALRDYQDPTAVPDVTVQNQYYGLATPFHVLAITGQLDYAGFDPFHLSLTGEFIKNVAFDRNEIVSGGPASNPGPQNNTLSGAATSFDGGDTGYLVHLDMGKASLEKLWDWNLRLSYRYVETDATVDAFTDSDFGANLTGTNLKGYTVGGNLALGSRVWAGLRWMSADNVSGPTFKNDLIQFDLNARF